ncbi:transposon ty3-I gag-pol polyprotein [Tanacetum coccineum]
MGYICDEDMIEELGKKHMEHIEHGGGNHPSREGNERGNPRFRTGFYDNHGRNQSPKRAWIHENIMFHMRKEKKPLRSSIEAKIPNFVGNLDIEAVLDWLYEVDKFFDIMNGPEEDQVKIVAYKLGGGAGALWQREQDNQVEFDVDVVRGSSSKLGNEGGEDGSRMLMGGRPNQSQLILPSTTNTTSSSNASGSGVDKNKKIQSVNSNSYDRPTGAKCFRCGEPGHRSNLCIKRAT